MIIVKTLATIILCFAIFYIWIPIYRPEKEKVQRDSPPGYEIVCDVDKGIYGVKMPSGLHIIEKDAFGKLFKTKKEALIRAWLQYEHVPKPEPPEEVYNWVKCE